MSWKLSIYRFSLLFSSVFVKSQSFSLDIEHCLIAHINKLNNKPTRCRLCEKLSLIAGANLCGGMSSTRKQEIFFFSLLLLGHKISVAISNKQSWVRNWINNANKILSSCTHDMVKLSSSSHYNQPCINASTYIKSNL